MGYTHLYAKAVKKQALKRSEKPIEASLEVRQGVIVEESQSKEELFKRALEAIKRTYLIGLYQWLTEQEELYKQLLDLEEKVEKAYLESMVTVEELRTTLKEYWNFHEEAVRTYEVSKHSKQSLQEELTL